MLSLIRKRIKNSEAAMAEFEAARREDLRSRESSQIAILREYIQDSSNMREEDIAAAIRDVIEGMRTEQKDVNLGSLMKALVGPGGSLESQIVDRSAVAKLAGGMI